MGLLDIFGSSDQTVTTKQKLPDWVENASLKNYNMARNIASRPYQAYPYQRVAGFTDDQNAARGMLRSWMPKELQSGYSGINLPRMIDNIPGATPGGVQDYMNPYIDNVLNRTQNRIRESTNSARQWSSNQSAHGAGAFGDARHGIADAEIEKGGIEAMADAAAQGYAGAYDNAQSMRNADINRLFQQAEFDRQGQDQVLEYIDSLFRSGSAEQSLNQQNASLMYEDFLRQWNYPVEMFNLMQAALGQSPYGQTSAQTSPGPSMASQGLGIIGSLLSLFG